MAQERTSETTLWALIRFTNWNNEIQIVNTQEITKVIVQSNVVRYCPNDASDFKDNLVYICQTALNSADGRKHPYCCQIYMLSRCKEELENIRSDKRLKWRLIPNFPADPDSSYSEHEKEGLHVLDEQGRKRKNTAQQKLSAQNVSLNSFVTSFSMQDRFASPSNQERNAQEQYMKRIAELEGQLEAERKKNERDNNFKVMEDKMWQMLEHQKKVYEQERDDIVKKVVMETRELVKVELQQAMQTYREESRSVNSETG
ncbi:Clock-controlled pheromone ccg-4 [Frankliniella fusca]|uniref:Clock-controlled pheromone ccg-4 n=1 Tax=Frankliniella fusca TaxID=407009 RepID=A0AAE1H193_9NEOP|nr:Clock-controlled pheromone ccg-4 [Frankliniella fusca]KAK3923000.1 Clock-controlled pheromone ccg-4 [Frankliniella fusca]KAK3931663.1 Clock-controlled pheromone ccg-4 [Frankliniella fusca]